MPGDNLLFLFVLLLLAAAAGAWFALRLKRTDSSARPSHPLSPDYFKGLNYLLNEQPDKAIEVFIRMAEVDNETVETHFALGNLFRRRGEVERAIRIHQNIIARPNLAKSQREQALYALAEDYLKAGLFDRAEKLLLQLSTVPGQRHKAMRSLVSIYEQQKDWAQAIEVRRKLGDLSGQGDRGLAHAYCELALQALDSGDHSSARAYLRKARVNGVQLVRSALMRADVADRQKDHKTAVKMCRWVIENDSSFCVEVLPMLLRNLRATGDETAVSKVLNAMRKKQADLSERLALAAIKHSEYSNPVLLEEVKAFLQSNDFAHHLVSLCSGQADQNGQDLDEQSVQKLSAVLEQMVRRRAAYDCKECGYSGNVLYWQCPSCKAWDSTRPVTTLMSQPSPVFA